MASSNKDADNYNININKVFGDATTETSTSGIGKTSWYSENSYFIGDGNGFPFFTRGGNLNNPSIGSFYFSRSDGYFYQNNFHSFRVCFAVK